MQSLHNLSYPAPHGKRFYASVIDGMIQVLLSQAIALLLLKETSPETKVLGTLLTFAIFPIYYIISHAAFGTTAGKKAMGLELICTDTQQKPSLGQVILRETGGRILASALLMLGYVMIFLNQDHRGLHDQLSKTQVITFEAPEERSWFRVLAGGAAFSVISWVLSFYLLFYTTIPLTYMAHELEKVGLHIDGIQGNLKHGFSARTVNWNNERFQFKGENLAFQYADIFHFFSGQPIRLTAIRASKIDLSIASLDSVPIPNPSAVQQNTLTSSSATAAQKFPGLLIDQINFENFKLHIAGQSTMEFNRFYLEKLELRNQTGQLNRLWLDSKKLNLDLQTLHYENQNLSFGASSLILRKDLFPDILTGDIDLKASGSGNISEKTIDLKLAGFRNSLSASLKNGQLILRLSNFQPQWYFKKTPPIHSLNLKFSGPWAQLLSQPRLQGGYSIRNRPFQFSKDQIPGSLFRSESNVNGKKIYASIQLNNLKEQFESPFQILLSSSHNSDLPNALADVYSWDPRNMTAYEAQAVLQDQKHFSFQKLQEPNFQIPQIRQPANFSE